MKPHSICPILSVFAFFSTAHAGTRVFESFEGDGFGTWKDEGTAFGKAPVAGVVQGDARKFQRYANEGLVCSTHGGDAATGTLTSAEFKIEEPYVCFLLGGNGAQSSVQLLVDDHVVLEAPAKGNLNLESVTWEVRKWQGKNARLRISDQSTEANGFIAVDHIIFTDYANQKFPITTRNHQPYNEDLVSSDKIPGLTLQKEVSLTVMADHPNQSIVSPTSLCFDETGALYVAETHRFRQGVEDDRNHLYWYLDDLAAQTTADRVKLHEKWDKKVPVASLTKKSEVIRRLTDQNGDGVFETTQNYADQFSDLLDGTAAGVFAYEGTVYFACIPKIWALRDENGDGLSDQRKVIQDGFGVRISLSGHDLNGFALGPDGMIYGTVGDRALNFTTREGKKYHYPNEGAFFRFEPDGSNFELIHTGLRNPKEIAFDEFGNAISVDNNSDQGDKARIVYLVPGGDSGWQMENQAMHTFYKEIGLDEHPINRWMAEKMWEPQNDAQPAYMLPTIANLTNGPSGLTYHPGVGFLSSEVGRFLICDYRGASASSGIFSFALSPSGAGMKLDDARQFNWGVAATDVEYTWDGKVAVADFMGGWVSHEDGRIYSLDAGQSSYRANEAKDAAKWIAAGISKQSISDLKQLLNHGDMRVRLRAHIALANRAEGLAILNETARVSDNLIARLHGIWGLGIIARRGDAAAAATATKNLIDLLGAKESEVRTQALRVLTDARTIPASAIAWESLLNDSSLRVRFYAALAAGKANAKNTVPMLLQQLETNRDQDVYLRHAIVVALTQLQSASELEALKQHPSASVRLAAVVALRRTHQPALVSFLKDASAQVANEAIIAIHDTMLESARPAVAALLDDLKNVSRTEMMWRRLIHSAFRCGGSENLSRLIHVASEPSVPDAVRLESMRLIAQWPEPFPVDQSIGRFAPLEKRDRDAYKNELIKALPQLIRSGGVVITSALQLMESLNLTLEGLGSDDLMKIATNAGVEPAARAKALDIAVKDRNVNLVPQLQQLSEDTEDQVALAATKHLIERSPGAAIAAIDKLRKSQTISRQQGAWTLLAGLNTPESTRIFVAAIEQLIADKGVSASAIELLDAARSHGSAEVQAAVKKWEQSLDPADPLATWMIALEGGNAERGKQLYLSHPAECMRCHRAGEGHEAGGEAGPNLGGVANRGDKKYFLESMMVPSAHVAAGYGVVSATLKDGSTVAGILLEQKDATVDIDAGEVISRIKRSDITEMAAPVSGMPPMTSLLKPHEARDLVAWLATLTKDVPSKATTKKIEEKVVSATAVAPPAQAAATPAGISAEQLKAGKAQYALCQACHGADGNGMAGVGPPLKGSEWVLGPVENLIRIQLRGLQGPITVKGTEYQLIMPPQAFQSDAQIADVLTYIRNAFGNEASAVTAAEVAALRSEVGKPMLSASELLPPAPPSKPSSASAGSGSGATAKTTAAQPLSFETMLGLPLWALGVFLAWLGVCLGIGLKPQN